MASRVRLMYETFFDGQTSTASWKTSSESIGQVDRTINHPIVRQIGAKASDQNWCSVSSLDEEEQEQEEEEQEEEEERRDKEEESIKIDVFTLFFINQLKTLGCHVMYV